MEVTITRSFSSNGNNYKTVTAKFSLVDQILAMSVQPEIKLFKSLLTRLQLIMKLFSKLVYWSVGPYKGKAFVQNGSLATLIQFLQVIQFIDQLQTISYLHLFQTFKIMPDITWSFWVHIFFSIWENWMINLSLHWIKVINTCKGIKFCECIYFLNYLALHK